VERKMHAGLKKWFKVMLIAVMATMVCTSARSAYCTADTDKALDKFLEEFVAKREKLLDYSARFTQTKTSTLFDEEETSNGRVFYLRPARILWDYRSPDAMQLLVKDRVLSIYIKELEQLEIHDFTREKQMRGLFLGFDESPKELKELYNIALVDPGEGEKGKCVKLVPKTEELQSYFTSVQLWLRPEDFAIYRILITDPEEEGQTSIRLDNIRVNRKIRESVFELQVPEGTDIIEYPHGEEEVEEIALPPDETG
jgi:outer membrane lipoprotein-sorting protein